jgi:hypothetical protein
LLAQAHSGPACVAFWIASGERSGRGDDDAHNLAEGFTPIALPHGKPEHGDVVTGMQPRIGLREDVGTLEVNPALCGIFSGLRGTHFIVINGACGDRDTRHSTLGQSDLSTIAGLLSTGAGLDLFGLRWPDIDQQWLASVLGQHPRLAFKRVVIEAARAEGDAIVWRA